MTQSVLSPRLLIFLLFVFLQAGLASGQTSQSRLVWVSRDGVEQLLATPPHVYAYRPSSNSALRAWTIWAC